jgi:Domain of unknown function (DUF1707)
VGAAFGDGLTGAGASSDTAVVADDGEVAAVSEPERDRALVRLRDRYAADELSIEDFSHGLDAVLAARTVGELERGSPTLASPYGGPNLSWRDSEALERHLPAGEELLWVGRPSANFELTRNVALAGLAALAFFAFWVASAAAIGAPVFFLLFGLVAFGQMAYQRFGRFAVSARRTAYAVTTRRLVRVVHERSGDRLDDALIRAIPTISVSASKNGRGTIEFGHPTSRTHAAWRTAFGARDADDDALRFVNIPDARDVAQLIGTLQAHEPS